FALSDRLGGDQPKQWLGDALALAAGLAWGLTTVVIRTSGLVKLSAEKLLFYQIGVSALLMPLLSLGMGERWSFNWSGFAVVSILLQTVVGAFISYLAWMWMLGRYPATKISGYVFLTPLFALIFSKLWLGDAITMPLIAGLTCVAVGMLIVNRKS
ncbi:MAG TPA: DMT family transporter, partial [Burkholderiaceae bacterium]|nr:DMT family transporter [Burkholderiaceae bacterium]